MKLFKTIHKKKAALITFLIAIVLFLMFFIFGLNYYDPPITYEIQLAFSSSYELNKLIEEESLTSKNKIKSVQLIKSKPNTNSTKTNNLLNEKESQVLIKNKTQKQEFPKPIENDIKNKILKEDKKTEVSQATKNVISNLLKINKKTKTDSVISNPENLNNEKLNGSIYSTSYYTLKGKEINYGLNGRYLQSSGKVIQDCNEEGVVVVRITVSPQGDVIDADAGVKGTSNINPCLLKPAIETALLHQWYPDLNAPKKQVGFVVIKFKLGE
jgi:hypothetical protein